MHVECLTPYHDVDEAIAHAARVTFPKRRAYDYAPLLVSLMERGHWSPFDMVSLLFEVSGISRACARQIIRHHSIRVQEASLRWGKLQERAHVEQPAVAPDGDDKHRTVAHPDPAVRAWYAHAQRELWEHALRLYDEALARGLHNEAARAFLPEGLTPTRLCLNGTVRSWIHFLVQRLHEHAQREVQLVALDIAVLIEKYAPVTMEAAYRLYPELRRMRDKLLDGVVGG